VRHGCRDSREITEGDARNASKYNSQELDKESGYYVYNARHYDPEIARFVTPDSVIDGELSTQGWNRYAYVHNNPIRYKDPTGHDLYECEIKPIKSDGILNSITNKLNEWSQDTSALKSGTADLFFKAKGFFTGGKLSNNKCNASSKPGIFQGINK
jgi:RHS repeat-associated protein